jgi:putative SOS response-associated peptidase YedK
LRTEANAVVTPIHPKAVVVVLTRLAEFDHWLEADTVEALALQRPLRDGALKIVARADRTGDAPEGLLATLI